MSLSNVGIAVATFDLDLVDLFVGQGRFEWHDAIGIIDVGLVAVASTAATATAIVSSTTMVASVVVVVSVLSIHGA